MSNSSYIGVFDDEEMFDKAVQQLTDSKIHIEEIYAPVPVHHAVKNVAGSSNLPLLAYFLGIGAIISIVSFLYYAAVISWPLNFGGKPSTAFPSFLIVTLILTIFSVTILSLLAFSISAKMYPGKKAEVVDERAVDDKFIIVLKSDKVADAEKLLWDNGAREVRNSLLATIVICCFAFTSCDRDKNNPGYDYFPDMAYSKAYETYASNPNFKDGKTLLAPVEGTISREAENYPYKKIDSDIPKAAKMKNPFSPDTENVARGKKVFQNICLQCHGINGDGKGFLFTSGKYPYPPANLVSQKIINRTDGEMFHTITVGFGIMPPHGIIVRPDDRWKAILYVRSLQKKEKGVAIP